MHIEVITFRNLLINAEKGIIHFLTNYLDDDYYITVLARLKSAFL